MPPKETFRIFAIIPVEDKILLNQILTTLGKEFGINIVLKQTELKSQGVCVCETASLQEAQIQARKIQKMGAGFRILDDKGRLRIESLRKSQDMQATKAKAPSVPPLPSQAQSKAQPAPPRQAIDMELTLLDGSQEDGVEPRTGVMTFGSTPKGNVPTASPHQQKTHKGTVDGAATQTDAFLPPSDDYPLELEESGLKKKVSTEANTGEFQLPANLEIETDGHKAAMALPKISERHAAAPFTRAREPHIATTSVEFPPPNDTMLLGEKIASRPRLKIILGLVASFMIGSILPMYHVHSTMTGRVQPLLQDLSNAKHYAKYYLTKPNHRTIEEIEDEISSIKIRHSFYAIFLWTFISGILMVVWFRFM